MTINGAASVVCCVSSHHDVDRDIAKDPHVQGEIVSEASQSHTSLSLVLQKNTHMMNLTLWLFSSHVYRLLVSCILLNL